ANSASESERAISATVSQEAVHAGSADYSNSANSALNAEVANVSYTALTANFLDGGWEHDVDGFITAYNNSAFAGAGGGGRYEGIEPIVVNNEEMRISAKSALLGVQDPLYFVEDSQTATVIGIHDSAFPTFEGTEDGKISAINGSAINAASVTEYSAGNNIDITDYVISVTGSVPSADRADYAVSATSSHFSHSAIEADTANYATESNHTHSADSATYDSLGRKIVDTYLTAHQPLPDWTPTIQNASGNAYNSAVNWVVDQHYLTEHQDVSDLPYVQNTALESNGILISGISGSGLYATSADNAFEADHAYEADYVVSGWEYDDEDRISGYKGSAFAGQGGQGIEYEGIAPIVVNNVEHKISAQSAKLGVQEPLYFVEDSNTATIIGISGLPEVEGVMYESALNFGDGYITGYNSSAFSAERAGYAVSATSANGAVSSQTANIVTDGWEFSDGKITGYNGTAVSAGTGHTQVPVSGVSGINITKPGDTVLISVTGKYIPYTNITTGDSGTTCYNVNSGIRVTAQSGWVEMYPQNNENESEAHLQVGQNYQNSSFWAEIDGADIGFFQMNWNSANIAADSHDSYSKDTTAHAWFGNGAIYYASANHALTAGGGYDNESKIWQLGSRRLRFWNTEGTQLAEFGSARMDINDIDHSARYQFDYIDNVPRMRIDSSADKIDVTPDYINFYDSAWNLDATINKGQISGWNEMIGSTPSRVVASTADATGTNILYIVTGS
ncbi:MAG: hypothetical protein IKE94_13000, partial [Aeriscardovia sp.]|nr:hypothetical protein [Aeriscardovia sp.]